VYGADLFILWDLVEQLGQYEAVAIAACGKFLGADVQRGVVDGLMHFALRASTLHAVLAGLPLTTAKKLDPGNVH